MALQGSGVEHVERLARLVGVVAAVCWTAGDVLIVAGSLVDRILPGSLATLLLSALLWRGENSSAAT